MKHSEYSIYYIVKEGKPQIDWFVTENISSGMLHTSDFTLRIAETFNPFNDTKYIDDAINNINIYANRYKIITPFVIYKDGKPFLEITDPEHIAKITELIIKQ